LKNVIVLLSLTSWPVEGKPLLLFMGFLLLMAVLHCTVTVWEVWLSCT